MSDKDFSRGQNIFWTAFMLMLFAPLFGSVISPLPFALLVPLTGVIFFLAHRVVIGSWARINPPLSGLAALLCSLFALLVASSLWSVTPDATFERALKVIGLILASFGTIAVAQNCPEQFWRKYNLLFPFAVFTVGVFTAFELYFDMPIYRLLNTEPGLRIKPDLLNKNVAVFAMSLPLAFYLAGKSRSVLFSIFLAFTAVALFFLTASQAFQLSLLVLIAAGIGCVFFVEKLTIRAAFLALGLVFLLLPWIAPIAFDLLAAKIAGSDGVMQAASTSLRLENWDFLSRRILENPLTGFGMDSTRAMTFDTDQLYFQGDHIVHPHNAALQMWIEFGVMGSAWSIALLIYLYALFTKVKASNRRLAFLTFCSVMVFLLISWSLWASWLLALNLYLVALCVLAAKTSNRPLNS